ncbi:hypothetical protein LVY72_16775 [Arthrobacter sp. I2-34]|uniref:MFS transporter n=1 Tax=Arthrobacter hankyongi TaxID=2904801 RepID=A0ABS9LAL8_9MICC|nr:hypothetical protein [Arthrobacter hankyongi]MCG2623553.1 hypothetical protein [Arthrobacter hankyongi]
MNSEPSPTPEGAAPAARGRRELIVRRAPKFVPFMVAGTVLGVVVAAVVALAGPESAEFTRGAVFGFFGVLFGLAGLLVGAVVALVLDRVGLKHAEHLYAEEIDPAAETNAAESGAANGTGTAGGTAGGPDGTDAQDPPERRPGG